MKRVVTEQWVAFDGVPHSTEADCRAYERRVAHIRMVGLKIEDVEAALSRADLDLAEAFEEVARRIKRIRLGRSAVDTRADEGRERSVIEIIESLKDDTGESDAA